MKATTTSFRDLDEGLYRRLRSEAALLGVNAGIMLNIVLEERYGGGLDVCKDGKCLLKVNDGGD